MTDRSCAGSFRCETHADVRLHYTYHRVTFSQSLRYVPRKNGLQFARARYFKPRIIRSIKHLVNVHSHEYSCSELIGFVTCSEAPRKKYTSIRVACVVWFRGSCELKSFEQIKQNLYEPSWSRLQIGHVDGRYYVLPFACPILPPRGCSVVSSCVHFTSPC